MRLQEVLVQCSEGAQEEQRGNFTREVWGKWKGS